MVVNRVTRHSAWAEKAKALVRDDPSLLDG
jgi:hypothetical protein